MEIKDKIVMELEKRIVFDSDYIDGVLVQIAILDDDIFFRRSLDGSIEVFDEMEKGSFDDIATFFKNEICDYIAEEFAKNLAIHEAEIKHEADHEVDHEVDHEADHKAEYKAELKAKLELQTKGEKKWRY